jgi:hypothetical protein
MILFLDLTVPVQSVFTWNKTDCFRKHIDINIKDVAVQMVVWLIGFIFCKEAVF